MQKKFIKKAEKAFILQKDQSDCGVACLLSVIRFYGGDGTLDELRKLSGTSIQGTTLLGLYQAANQIGFEAEGNEADIQALIEHGKPLILHCLIDEKLEHYIVWYGYSENDGFLIGDPGEGIKFINEEELKKIWKSKICLTLEPTEKFIQQKSIRKTKKEWFLELLKDDRKLLIFSVLLGVGFALLNMAMAVFSQKLIDDILPSKKMEKLIGGIILLSLLLSIRVGFSAMRSYILTLQSRDFNNRIIHFFYSNLLLLPKPFFDTRKIGELTARLNDTNRIQRVIQHIINNFVIDILMVLVSLGFLFYYSWEIGLIALFSLPIYFLLIYKYNKKIIDAQKEVMQNYAMSESNYISTMQGIAEIKNYNRQHFFQILNQSIYGRFQDKIFNLGIVNIRISLYSGLVGVAFLICVLAVASFMVLDQQLDLGELMAILGIAGSLLPSVANLALISIPINEAKIAFDRMYEFTSIEKEKEGNVSIDNFDNLIIKDLGFRFPGRSSLFESLNLEINRRKITAFVGESGGGKSTLAQILQKFYEPETGSIIVNNHFSLSEIKNEDWRKIVGVIPQEVKLFNGTILDNILLGIEVDINEIQVFIEKYEFVEFIESLPQGLATIVGEEGINLSGGQKQILALMRALFHNPKLLILDEPTSAMDRKTEQLTLNILNKLKSDIAIFIISHRLDTLPVLADKIYVLENRTVRYSGSHSELLTTSNFYSDYFQVISG